VYQGCGGLAGAGLLAGRAGCALDSPLGDSVPPVLPLLGGAGQVAGVDEPVPAERAAAVLPGWPLIAPDALADISKSYNARRISTLRVRRIALTAH